MNTEGYQGIWLTGQPFSPNPKCIFASLAICGIYALPRLRGAGLWFMMVFIFIVSYISLSVYDYVYQCQSVLTSAKYGVSGIFKPQTNNDRAPLPYGRRFAADQELAYRKSVYWTHTAMITPLVMISSALAMRDRKRDFDAKNTPSEERSYSLYPAVFGLGALGFAYHGFRMFHPRTRCTSI